MATTTMTPADRLEIERALDNHESLKNTWFWNDNGNAKARVRRENKLNFLVEVTDGNGDVYEYCSTVSISRKNFYYKGAFSKNGKKGDVRLFKKLLAVTKKEGK
jgi:hypothetical protein